jgi:hypothetical protein
VRDNVPYVRGMVTAIAVIVFLTNTDSTMHVLCTIGMALLLSLLHAATRCRNLKSRVNNELHIAGVRVTVMGRVLEMLGIEI